MGDSRAPNQNMEHVNRAVIADCPTPPGLVRCYVCRITTELDDSEAVRLAAGTAVIPDALSGVRGSCCHVLITNTQIRISLN